MIIGNIDTDKKVLIIAEIGNNHEGNMDNAIRLVYEAADCGVDGVKFQTYKTEFFISHNDKARFERLKSFELTYNQFSELSKLAHSLGLLFISTPLDIESAQFLNSIVDAYKIASGDNNFYPLIEIAAKTGKPLIVSTGASDQNQIAETVAFIENVWKRNHHKKELALLHCVSCYPTPIEQTSLLSIKYLSRKYGYVVGYSDHTIGIEIPQIAVALGARIIEKHFTLNKSFSTFRDHQLSADPRDMQEMVQRIHTLSKINEKQIQPCEKDNAITIRRSIVAKTDLVTGHKITMSDLMWIRPAEGLAPGNEYKLLNKKIKRDIISGEPLYENDVE